MSQLNYDSSIYTSKGYTKKIKEYTNRITYESFWPHTHIFWEIFIITNGEVTHYFNDMPKRLGVGDAVILKPGDCHYFKNATAQYEHRDLYINTYTFKSICDTITPTLYTSFQNVGGLMYINVKSPQLEYIVNMLDELHIVQDSNNSEMINALHIPLVTSFVGSFMKKYYIKQDVATREFNEFLIKMNTTKYICGTLDDIVKLSNYSHGYLCKIFKENTGKTLKNYHNELKMNYAIGLLINNNLSILEISSMLGYNSLSHFIKLFKAYTSLTPKSYRQNFFERKHEKPVYNNQ